MGQIKNIKLHIVTDIKKYQPITNNHGTSSPRFRILKIDPPQQPVGPLRNEQQVCDAHVVCEHPVHNNDNDEDDHVHDDTVARQDGRAPTPHGYGTKKNPILVPTLLDERVVGCCCEGLDGGDAILFLLTWDDPEQRCGGCGCAYKLVHAPVYDKVAPFDGEDHYDEEHH